MTVHLVGAGCGTPSWLTLRGAELLRTAEAVVYDRLIHPDLLQLCPKGCEYHPVGKRESDHTLPQKEINALLVELGKRLASVVRLKGGDPFVFGRGGEEALALEEAGLSWDAVPGITAALGGCAAAGLPPTHRGLSGAVTLATGRLGDGGAETTPDNGTNSGDPRRNFLRELGAVPGTLCLYMSASSFAEAAPFLEAGGVTPDTPGACVTWGGWGRATLRSGTFGELIEASRRNALRSPSVLVLGRTAGVALHPLRGPLAGLQVAVCRPAPESWNTARRLEQLGADAYSVPLLELEERPLQGAADLLARADWIVCTSPRGAAQIKRCASDLRRLRGRLAAIGEGTARALALEGLPPDVTAEEPTSEGLARLLRSLIRPGERVAFVRNERASSLPEEAVRQAGGVPFELAAYRMIPKPLPGEELYRELWRQAPLHAVVFGSAALAEAWWDRFGGLPPGAVPVAWGETCARRIRELLETQREGGRDVAVLESPDLPGLERVLRRLNALLSDLRLEQAAADVGKSDEETPKRKGPRRKTERNDTAPRRTRKGNPS